MVFKLIKMHLLVSEPYIYQNARCDWKKNNPVIVAGTNCTRCARVAVILHVLHVHQLTTDFHRCTTLTLIYRITLRTRTLTLTFLQMSLPYWHRIPEYTTRLLYLLAVRHRSYAGARCMVTSPVGWCLAHEICGSLIFHHPCTYSM